MRDEGHRSDREVMEVFAKNLKELVSGEPSVTHCCRALEINRSQFNRYLNGTSYPHPLVLRRICDYFDVDARILFEPLANLGRTGQLFSKEDMLKLFLPEGLKPASAETLPDGVYATYAQSAVHPGKVRFCPMRIYTQHNIRHMFLKTPSISRDIIPGAVRAPRITRMHGMAFQQGAGVVLIARDIRTNILFFQTFSPGFTLNDHSMFGIGTAGSSLNPRWRNSVTNCVIEPLPYNPIRRSSVLRTPRILDSAGVPDHIIDYLELAGNTVSYQ